MPNFDKLKFTNSGLKIQTSAQAGGLLKFSKIKIGSGTYIGDASNLTELINPVLEAGIIAGNLTDNTYTVEASFSNDGLKTGFYWSEIGLYVKDENDNDVLYAYSSASGSTDYVPSESESGYLKRIKIAVIVGNATNIEFVQSAETYVDAITFNEKIDEIRKTLSDIQTEIPKLVTDTELEKVVKGINDNLETIEKDLKDLSENIKTISEQKIGDANISHIGAGTITGAIVELYNLINKIPSISSGTTEPTGGEDGDVYIMYEE